MDPIELSKLVDEIKIFNDDEPTLKLEEEEISINEKRMDLCLAAKALDRRRALENGPWNFFRDLVILKAINGMQNPNSFRFNDISIWIQCHNLPPALMNGNLLERIGNQIGITEKVDSGINGNFLGNFSRIRVRIDVTQPIKRFVRIGMGGKYDDLIVILTYERLPDFFYACGRIGHPHRECDKSSDNVSKLEYGTWLRAIQPTGMRNNKQQNPSSSSDKQSKRHSSIGDMDREDSHSPSKNLHVAVIVNDGSVLCDQQVAVHRRSENIERSNEASPIMKKGASADFQAVMQESTEITTAKGKEKVDVLIPGDKNATQETIRHTSWKQRARGVVSNLNSVSPSKVEAEGKQKFIEQQYLLDTKPSNVETGRKQKFVE